MHLDTDNNRKQNGMFSEHSDQLKQVSNKAMQHYSGDKIQKSTRQRNGQ